ncbi:Ty1/Copia family ribonuclease HI [bacterium]|nr:Ty1/Copia family ribonuclease HI [bacterium]
MVGEVFNNEVMGRVGLFAGPPPLEAFIYLIHAAATVRATEPMGSNVLMIHDVSRALCEARATRNVCVELPAEYVTDADRRHDKVGRLRLSLYGTKGAAIKWQYEVAREIIKAGFRRGRYYPCLCFHERMNLRTFLNRDDFAAVGTNYKVQWLKDMLEKRSEINIECLSFAAAGLGGLRDGAPSGPSPKTTNGSAMQEGSEARLLNRVVRCTLDGWEVEPDQRHADLIVQEPQLSGANGVTSPREHDSRDNGEELNEELGPGDATMYIAIAAGANYLAADGPDIMYAVKELCRGMANPTNIYWHKLKRLGRYLVEHGRNVLKFKWQGHESEVIGHSDSDWAGCRVTGKSTSGGALMIGGQFIKCWARTQNHVTLSSAEAELVALMKCSAELLGIRSMLRYIGVECGGIVYADSSAALAIAKRKGASELRHININFLWIKKTGYQSA